ncbi:MAG: SDR family oxidoreductase [Deltaproteobacteria bacterium]|nr:SDR family oxidoreductase [Deltaproteobacteria bacterium]MBW2448016.1 SDR family oxidoreductase [Deltaproteobacteria bacterium]
MPQQGAYAATKGGLNALVRSVAVELGRHDIQANCVLPGWIETPATAPALDIEKLNDTIIRRTPAHRWGHSVGTRNRYFQTPERRAIPPNVGPVGPLGFTCGPARWGSCWDWSQDRGRSKSFCFRTVGHGLDHWAHTSL